MNSEPDTLSPKQFEDFVRELLHIAGYYVDREKLIGHKKVDVYAEERRFGTWYRIAVECKQYASPLKRQEIVSILVDYEPLLGAHVDEILIVTANGLAPSAARYVEDHPAVLHTTAGELQDGIMDFTAYLQGVVREFAESGTNDYYIRPTAAPVGDLEAAVDAWLISSKQPLALLGGYGIGKTTFARRMAAKLAAEHLADRSRRIPVYIRLGDIGSEQSLEGLLGRVLTTGRGVRNYGFDAFMKLNARSRFVILLDGFDEMKQTLTVEQFRRNFTELNRLVVSSSRVILSGRPTAFISDDEQQRILHGVVASRGPILREPGWPDYIEYVFQPFDHDQVRTFVSAYLRHLRKTGVGPYDGVSDVDLTARIQDLDAGRLQDLSVRPVQLRMLVEVLPQWRESLVSLTRTTLYGTFIDLVIAREQEKDGRGKFPIEVRRRFARRLAYWMWMRDRSSFVRIDDVPKELYPEVPDTLPDAVRRDILSACFLERKAGDIIFFPHRSFQEFLVAEEIVAKVRQQEADVLKAGAAVNPEITDFIESLITPDTYAGLEGLLQGRSNIPENLLAPWLRNRKFIEWVERRIVADATPWHALLLALTVSEGTGTSEILKICDRLVRVIEQVELSKREAHDLVAAALLGIAIALSYIEKISPMRGGAEFLRILERQELRNRLRTFRFIKALHLEDLPDSAALDLDVYTATLRRSLEHTCGLEGWMEPREGTSLRRNIDDPTNQLPTGRFLFPDNPQVKSLFAAPLAQMSPGSELSISIDSEIIPLAPGVILIGRDAFCDIRITGRQTSRRHARITITEHDAVIEDLQSTNGTLVRGTPVTTPTPLHAGDTIEIGDKILYIHDESYPTPEQPKQKV